MDGDKKLRALLLTIAIAVWMLVLQNAGIIPPLRRSEVIVANTVGVTGYVNVSGSVDVDNTVSVEVDNTVDVNLAEVVGYGLVTSQQGMYIGVTSTKNTIIPIHWGEVSTIP